MHLASAFIRRNARCVKGLNFYQLMLVNFDITRTHDLGIANANNNKKNYFLKKK